MKKLNLEKLHYHCHKCNKKIHRDDVIWASCNGKLNTITGFPWCIECLPTKVEDYNR